MKKLAPQEKSETVNQKNTIYWPKTKKIKKTKHYIQPIYTTTKNGLKIVGLAIIHRDTCIN